VCGNLNVNVRPFPDVFFPPSIFFGCGATPTSPSVFFPALPLFCGTDHYAKVNVCNIVSPTAIPTTPVYSIFTNELW